jgi:hypothetical protein
MMHYYYSPNQVPVLDDRKKLMGEKKGGEGGLSEIITFYLRHDKHDFTITHTKDSYICIFQKYFLLDYLFIIQ